MANTKQARAFLEACYFNTGSVNSHFDLDAYYEGLRSRFTDPCPHATSKTANPATRSPNDSPPILSLQRRERSSSARPLSLVFAHTLECDHRFNWDGTEVVAMANTKQARAFLEACYFNTGSVNSHFDLDAYYEGLRSRFTDPCPHATSKTANPATRSPNDSPPILSLQRRERSSSARPLSLVFAHTLECDHRFNWDGTEVVAMANTKQARAFLEACYFNTGSVNSHFDLDAYYEGLRSRFTDPCPHATSKTANPATRSPNDSPPILSLQRRERSSSARPLSLVFAHTLECDHRFNWDGTEVVAMANTKQARAFLEACYFNTGSVNSHFDLDAYYEGLRSRFTDPCPHATSKTANPATRSPNDSPPILSLQRRER
ncbi:hypothetical protein SprV_0501845000 [Sparganum proliferum]